MKIQLFFGIAGALLLSNHAAHAQFGVQNPGQNRGGANGNNRGGGVFQLPQGVERLVALDAYNTLIAQTRDDDGTVHYSLIPVRHIYAGGIAALFGGTTIPTAQFVSPGGFGNGGGGGGRGIGTTRLGGGNTLGGIGVGNNNFGNGNGLFQTPNGNFGLNQTNIIGPNGTQTPLPNAPVFGPAF